MESNEEVKQLSADDRLEYSVGGWMKSLEGMELLVESMTKNELTRAIKAVFAFPLEHEKIKLVGEKEAKLLDVFAKRDADKFNAMLAQLEIQGQQNAAEKDKEK